MDSKQQQTEIVELNDKLRVSEEEVLRVKWVLASKEAELAKLYQDYCHERLELRKAQSKLLRIDARIELADKRAQAHICELEAANQKLAELVNQLRGGLLQCRRELRTRAIWRNVDDAKQAKEAVKP